MALTRFAPFPVVFSSSSSESLYPSHKLCFAFHIKNLPSLFVARSGDPGWGMLNSDAAVEKKIDGKVEAMNSNPVEEKKAEMKKMAAVPSFEHPWWIQGRWDLNQFNKGGRTDWDAVIDAEARRRQWLEGNPEASRNDESIPFNTSIIPWWVWAKRYYLPDPKLLKGKVAVFGFFAVYFVDSLTTVGLVDQRESFLWKSLLFLLVLGVLLLRKNEDFGKVKKFIEETTSYDNQWKAALKDDSLSNNKN